MNIFFAHEPNNSRNDEVSCCYCGFNEPQNTNCMPVAYRNECDRPCNSVENKTITKCCNKMVHRDCYNLSQCYLKYCPECKITFDPIIVNFLLLVNKIEGDYEPGLKEFIFDEILSKLSPNFYESESYQTQRKTSKITYEYYVDEINKLDLQIPNKFMILEKQIDEMTPEEILDEDSLLAFYDKCEKLSIHRYKLQSLAQDVKFLNEDLNELNIHDINTSVYDNLELKSIPNSIKHKYQDKSKEELLAIISNLILKKKKLSLINRTYRNNLLYSD